MGMCYAIGKTPPTGALRFSLSKKNGFVLLAAIVAIRTLINFHEGIYTEELIRRSMYRILPLLLLGGFFLTGEF